MSIRIVSYFCNGCLSSDAKAYKIMDSFIRDNRTLVHAKLHGFRFASTITGEESDITISCAVKICTANSGQCNDVSKVIEIDGLKERERT
jgi:hypothetical protein